MTPDRIRDLLRARPFERFLLRLADGQTIPVDHPELLSLSPSGRTAVVFERDDSMRIVDVMLVTEALVRRGSGTRRTQSRGR